MSSRSCSSCGDSGSDIHSGTSPRAALLWVCTLESGVHATIAGVVLGLLVPMQRLGGHDVGAPLERLLHPWSSFVVVPLFALANAGVDLSVHEIKGAFTGTIGWGIVLGLVVGKPVGIALAAAITLKLRVGVPSGVKMKHLVGAGCVVGIGFTVSLFVADLSFEGGVLAEAKIAVLAASLVSATVGATWLLFTLDAEANALTYDSASVGGGPPQHADCVVAVADRGSPAHVVYRAVRSKRVAAQSASSALRS